MSAGTETAVRRRRPGRSATVAIAVLVLLGVAALVAIPLGGWSTATLRTAEIPELAVGETYAGRHFSVSIEEAWVGETMPDDYDVPEEGMTFVVVRAVLRNEWVETDSGAAGLLLFDALDALKPIDRDALVRVVADGTWTSALPPGVETEVLLRWEVPLGSVTAGEPLELHIVDGRPDRAVLYSGTIWRDEHAAVRVTLVPHPSDELVYPWSHG
ncbi:hypothetical protein [Protaetiibacter intestinalis]|uniref:Uncharacterized protein n=1 Tax=Protaetiibacter intestinalis TaxID=2419774 RepID=A0A387BDC2_9MICO|nr:hypothetical protein [Protaetiibacter intestinalis]AYF98879.1 hypothetical protein D7I47_11855 [Protaetiibacter intestinalis]